MGWKTGSQSAASLSTLSCMHGWMGHRRPKTGRHSSLEASTVWSDCNPARVHPLYTFLMTPRFLFLGQGFPPLLHIKRPLFFKSLGQHGNADDHQIDKGSVTP
ncbi:uncharacterized protein BDW47DRAFT_17742 [Aspergillus candidus]|uniref:Uncharacterized protein n=1 Tax=Aspergillus candidus TaxID=41067 RepID=A0A2I2FE56_ASPCN|nr:hypothetical protein BDW47DRAFT_17742 [Aspergillus candidus]PLB38910.1 hypothetical protein BDW47DRAFT_17742 [Aspergillus candidus]